MVSEHASPLAVVGGVDAGGQNVHVAALARALARQGHDVEVFTRRDDENAPPSVRLQRGVRVVHVDAGPPRPIPKDEIAPHVPEFARLLADSFRHRPPDVVHAHYWMSGLASLEAGRDAGIPIAMTFHALGVTKRQWQGADDSSPDERVYAEAMLARECDQLIATARLEVFELARMGAPASHISLVPCGVDGHRFRPDGPVGGPKRERKYRLLCVSRLVPRKGVDIVIQALAAVRDTELLIAGGPSTDEWACDDEVVRLAAMARAVGVSDRVQFLGPMHPRVMPALYRSADAVVCTPWYEPFGMVALEAMACGVPPVVATVGGLIDTVQDRKTGVHVPPNDAPALACALAELLPDEARRRALAEGAVHRAHHAYEWPAIAQATLRAYRECVPAGRRTRRKVG
jgi:glycosyltransferase involved in cell wall biosynthesis